MATQPFARFSPEMLGLKCWAVGLLGLIRNVDDVKMRTIIFIVGPRVGARFFFLPVVPTLFRLENLGANAQPNTGLASVDTQNRQLIDT